VIILGSGRATTLGELLDVIRDVCGDAGVEVHPARSFDLERTWLDISTARSVLGWVPQVCLREGIVDMWDWLRANSAR
jgi:UDP-glucose 4-epimerase